VRGSLILTRQVKYKWPRCDAHEAISMPRGSGAGSRSREHTILKGAGFALRRILGHQCGAASARTDAPLGVGTRHRPSRRDGILHGLQHTLEIAAMLDAVAKAGNNRRRDKYASNVVKLPDNRTKFCAAPRRARRGAAGTGFGGTRPRAPVHSARPRAGITRTSRPSSAGSFSRSAFAPPFSSSNRRQRAPSAGGAGKDSIGFPSTTFK